MTVVRDTPDSANTPIPYTLTPRGYAALITPGQAAHNAWCAEDDWHELDSEARDLWEAAAQAAIDAAQVEAVPTHFPLIVCLCGSTRFYDEWACESCGAGWFGTKPDDGLCPDCQDDN